jgi:hypothetical protein
MAPPPPTLSITDSQIFTAFRSFLLSVTLPNTDVIKAQVNRVPEPLGADFVLMTPLRQERLATNETSYFDNDFTGTIAGTTLTVSAFARQESPLSPGMLLIDSGYPVMNLAVNTVIVDQISGSPPGGIGTYTVAPSQTVAQETMYAGVRADLVGTKMVVQLDIHGPNSGNNVRLIDTLFRSEVGTASFESSGLAIDPLYCDDAKQMPFVNDQQQYEDRWVMEACLQFNAVVGTPQQFAVELEAKVIEAAVNYTGP